MKFAFVGAGALAAAGTAYYFTREQRLSVGGFNMQYGPYKISRIDKETTGLDPIKKSIILEFNNYCMKKALEDSPLTDPSSIFAESKDREYEEGLFKCLSWKEVNGKYQVDVAKTFQTYFSADNHELWTSAIVDTSKRVANDILDNGVSIMALVETAAGNKNNRGEIIPHTDNLIKLLENLNNSPKVDFRIGNYAQFVNPVSKLYPQLDRGNAIIYDKNKTDLLLTFTINLSSEKRGEVTTRRYPVCVFGKDNKSEVAVCAAHVSGYAAKDSLKGGNSQNVLVGDTELENVLKVLTFDSSANATITIGNEEKKVSQELLDILAISGFNPNIPLIIIGDFNQDFNRNSFEYEHTYRFPTFEPHDKETVAGKYGFTNGYSVAKRIHPTTRHGETIDGFLLKNINSVTLVSSGYDSNNAVSDHSMVLAKL